MGALKNAVRSRASAPMVSVLRNLHFEIKALGIGRRSKPKFDALQGKTGLKVHIGAGDDIRLGWVNIDLRLRLPPDIDEAAAPGTVFINHDLRRGLPLDDSSCAFIYSSHFFEHIDFEEAGALLAECRRVLQPGGILRLALPNFRDMFRAYIDGDVSYFDLYDLPNSPSDPKGQTKALIDHVNYGVYQDGEHKSIWDADKALKLLKKAGFSVAREVAFDADVDPGLPLRQRYSFYVEGVR